LQSTTNFACLYPTYFRGEAYLASGALAHLGVARANAWQSRTSQGADADAARVRALAAYRDFLTLWKDTSTQDIFWYQVSLTG
jgi:hypothetical protein